MCRWRKLTMVSPILFVLITIFCRTGGMAIHYRNLDACVSEKALSAREKDASAIVTATVFSLMSYTHVSSNLKSEMWKGQVVVKRVVKGDKELVQSTSVLVVENFGDPAICDATVVKRDTKIFLLTKNLATGDFRLNSSVIRMTLKNLDRISASVKGQAVTTNRPPIPEVPCERMFCGRGSVCKINSLTGNAFCSETEDPCRHRQCLYGATCVGNYITGRSDCVCPSTCDSFADVAESRQPSAPVCGSDNATYESTCQLRLRSCQEQRPIQVDSIGVCGGCQRKQCDFYATCQVDSTGTPNCVCPVKCSSERKPVCGVDGVTYDNECQLKKTACEQMRFIVVAAPVPCESVPSKLTTPSEDYEEIDRDEDDDGDDDEPNIAGVRTVSQCDPALCRDFGGICSALPNGGIQCLCQFNCSLTRGDAVCGKSSADDEARLFSNECFLREHSCRQMKRITWLPATECEGNAAASTDCNTKPYGCCPDGVTDAKGPDGRGCHKPVNAGSRIIDQPCTCNKIGAIGPVCDQETKRCKCYPGVGGSRCDRCRPGFWGLQKTGLPGKGCVSCSCSNFGSVRTDCEQMSGRCVCKPGVLGAKCDKCPHGLVLQPSGCISADRRPLQPSSCGELLCHLGAICIQKSSEAVACVCNMTCKEPEDPQVVCGSDGLTYLDVCQLRLHACRRQMDVTVAALGPCEEAGRGYVTNAPIVVTPHAELKSYLDEEALSEAVQARELSATKDSQAGLGTYCLGDEDCLTKHSICANKKCICRLGYDMLIDKNQCAIAKSKKAATPCSKLPCKNGGTCSEPTPATYLCSCRVGFRGRHCQDESLEMVPAFNGKSYFELRPARGYTQMTIGLEFKSHMLDGILVYNGQKPDGGGDFFSLSLNNGYVEFRFDLGDGPVTIRSSVPITLEKRHRIEAKRFNQDGLLKLDGYPEVQGRCPGSRKYLDLEDSLFVGYVPISNPVIFDKIGTKSGLVGCIYSMKVGKGYIGLTEPDYQDTIAAFEIGECGKSPCASSPCQHGGTCEATSKGLQYLCRCREGYSGHQCEISSTCKNCQTSTRSVDTPDEDQVFVCADGSHKAVCDTGSASPSTVPSFSGSSFVILPKMSDVNPNFNLEIWFLIHVPNGLLLYASQKADGEGDFISLNIRHGKVEFIFDLGDGPVNITHPEIVNLSNWHSVKVFRHGKRASLQLDSAPAVSSESQGALAELNLNTVTYIGGARHHQVFSKDAKIDSFFDGAMQLLRINQKTWNDFSRDAVETHKIIPYHGPPCRENVTQCKNGGICIPRLSKFRCKCSPAFTGELCQKEKSFPETDLAQNRAIHFDGHMVLEYPNMVFESLESQDQNLYDLRIKTTSRNGLILWQSKAKNIRGDFFALAIIDGQVELTFDLGKEQDLFAIRSEVFVSDGKWHTIMAERRKRSGILSVDNEKPQIRTSTPGTTALDTNGKLYIGGFTEMPPGFGSGYYQGFHGCLSNLTVGGIAAALTADGNNGLQPCPDEGRN